MPWTEITRLYYQRGARRYACDMMDCVWGLVAPFMPEPSRLGRPRTTELRDVVDALLCVASTGCQWRQLPLYSMVRGYFYRWAEDGTLPRINQALVMAAREAVGRKPSPTAGVIDSQSVKTTEAGSPRGFDAIKKINGRKRHIVTDTLGHLVGWLVHPVDVQDRDGAAKTLATLRSLYPRLRYVFTDGGYAGDKLRGKLARMGRWTVEIIKPSDTAKRFEVLPRRWVFERTFAWLGRCRRLAKDFEAHSPAQLPGCSWLIFASSPDAWHELDTK